ncbi:MAG: hypothetical protein PHD81_04090 [Candidatus Nanoarchaeia archaeon]|nr:hypothetical protein [Candidatus Nanoarchaeia archaeon]MDD5588262.1 hypothetical protein [Candidatus Nanoarchaeia archaeon]
MKKERILIIFLISLSLIPIIYGVDAFVTPSGGDYLFCILL